MRRGSTPPPSKLTRLCLAAKRRQTSQDPDDHPSLEASLFHCFRSQPTQLTRAPPAVSQKSTFGSRLSAALGSDRDQSDSDTLSRRRPAPSRASSLSVGIGHPPVRTKSMSRRAVSEAQALTAPGVRIPNDAFGLEEGEETPTGNPVLHHHRRRRHSIATMRDPPEPFQWLSRCVAILSTSNKGQLIL